MRAMMRELFRPHRVKCLFGGRGSGKSWDVCEALIEIAVREAVRVLCLRRVQKSIKASSYQLLVDTIKRLGYEGDFTITKTSIRSDAGAEFFFEGLQSNLDSIKSIEGVDIAWIEEAHSVSKEAWEVLLPTIRRPSSELWITFNPFYAWDETYVRFVINAADDWFVQKVNWTDNQYFTDALEKERLHCLKYYPDEYPNIWEGEPVADMPGSVIGRGSLQNLILPDNSDLARINRNGIITGVLDVADDGGDHSVFNTFDGSHLVDVRRLQARDVVQLADQAVTIGREIGASEIIYDAIGVGAGVKGQFNKHHDAGIIFRPFVASAAPLRASSRYRGGRSNEDTFENLRAQGWWMYRDAVNDSNRFLREGIASDTGLFSVSDKIPRRYIERLLADSSAPLWEINNSGKIQIEKKMHIKKRIGVSTDYADATIPKMVKFTSGLGAY
ncbi:PBSX family phage terminase large subunit [Salmonella enterica]|nr:PBSX family phage terminase large subunit [Salmonella enterica subsp. enterica]EHO5928716.1 PBSX family phage terminase large subunit [Salmonella enterica]